jgi:hypothetical protein
MCWRQQSLITCTITTKTTKSSRKRTVTEQIIQRFWCISSRRTITVASFLLLLLQSSAIVESCFSSSSQIDIQEAFTYQNTRRPNEGQTKYVSFRNMNHWINPRKRVLLTSSNREQHIPRNRKVNRSTLFAYNGIAIMETLRDWSPLDPESLSPTKCLIEQTLCVQPDNNDSSSQYRQPQLAKDYDYANAILEAWQGDEVLSLSPSTSAMWNTEWKSVKYYDEDVPLYGHFIRKKPSTLTTSTIALPPLGILFFHTGAGPHDIFLLWKASSIVNTLFTNDDPESDNNHQREVVVFIADMLSDDCGWGWNDDRTMYKLVFDNVFGTASCSNDNNENGSLNDEGDGDSTDPNRPVLQSRIKAAIATLQNELSAVFDKAIGDSVNGSTNKFDMGALGWCLGGHSILELSKMYVPSMLAMATFHGVFNAPISMEVLVPQHLDQHISRDDGIYDATIVTDAATEVLVCHGYDDKFVSNENLQVAL